MVQSVGADGVLANHWGCWMVILVIQMLMVMAQIVNLGTSRLVVMVLFNLDHLHLKVYF